MTIEDLTRYILFACLMGFGIYSILYVIFTFFIKKDLLQKFDAAACHVITVVGVINFIVYALWIFAMFKGATTEDLRYQLLNRMFGPYWFGFWLQPAVYVFIPLFMWFKKMRNLKWLRLALSPFLIISFEKFIILITAFHRDYLPSSWTIYWTWHGILYGGLVNLAIFLIIVGIYYVIKTKWFGGIVVAVLFLVTISSCSSHSRAVYACKKCYGNESLTDSTDYIDISDSVTQDITYYPDNKLKETTTSYDRTRTSVTICYRKDGTKCLERFLDWKAQKVTVTKWDKTGTRIRKKWKYKYRPPTNCAIPGVSF